MCESHVYRHKTLISLIKDNVWICESGVRNYFSPLTHKSRQIVLQHMIYSENSIQFPLKYSKKALKDGIIRKSKHAKVVIFWSFGSAQRLSEHLWMFLATFGSLPENHRTLLVCFRKSRLWQGKNLTHLTQKKLAGYYMQGANSCWSSMKQHKLNDFASFLLYASIVE